MLLRLQYTLRQFSSFKRVIVGVSGGADSVCLALLLKSLGYEVIVAHLNHQLRGRHSDDDAAFVKSFAQKLRVPCVIEAAEIPRKGNLEANARQVRYAFFEDVRRRFRADCIAVAHHEGDQLETVLMHLVRGAGVRGLAGMSPERGRIIRPLLDVTKKEILRFLKERGQAFRTDATNNDLRFLRNRLRHLVIPAFQKENPWFAANMLDFSRDAREELDRRMNRAQNWLKVNAPGRRFERESFRYLEPDLKGEVILTLVGTTDLYAKHLNAVIRFIGTGKTGKRLTLKNTTFILEYEYVRVEALRRTRALSQKTVTVQGIRWGEWVITKKGRRAVFVRPWRPGDRFTPAGMEGAKKLQDFFVDAKIPRDQRGQIPIVVNTKDEILSIGNLRWSEQGKKEKGILVQKRPDTREHHRDV